MVLGETYKPVRPKASPEVEELSLERLKAKPANENDTFAIKYTFSFLAAVCAETSTN